MKSLCIVLALFTASVFAQQSNELTATSPAAFKPVTVNLTLSLSPDDPMMKASRTFTTMQPTMAIWSWGEHSKVDHSDLAWPKDGLTQTVSHVYSRPGEYVVSVTVLDEKHRLIVQQAVKIRVAQPVEVIP